jgi:hypothetical protein
MSTTLTSMIAAGLLAATALIGVPIANADPCNQTVGQSIDAYLQRHPDIHQQLQASSQAEGGGPDVMGYLSRHPDIRQHLINLSQQCTN